MFKSTHTHRNKYLFSSFMYTILTRTRFEKSLSFPIQPGEVMDVWDVTLDMVICIGNNYLINEELFIIFRIPSSVDRSHPAENVTLLPSSVQEKVTTQPIGVRQTGITQVDQLFSVSCIA
jgi:hypothetical protein